MTTARPAIAVFGSSEPREGEPLYELARQIGELLGQSGFDVVTGGYGGVMEGASRGARDAGANVVGVTCEIFSARPPNRYLTEETPSEDLHLRTRELIRRSDGFVILEGKAGTLAELSFLWALMRAGCLASKPVIVWGDAWADMIDYLGRRGMLDEGEFVQTARAASPEDILRYLRRKFPRGES
jgi:uncharacterized protein (TIGR00730 family)